MRNLPRNSEDMTWSKMKKNRMDQKYSIERKNSIGKWLVRGTVDEKLKRFSTKNTPNSEPLPKLVDIPVTHNVKDMIKLYEHASEEFKSGSRIKETNTKKTIANEPIHKEKCFKGGSLENLILKEEKQTIENSNNSSLEEICKHSENLYLQEKNESIDNFSSFLVHKGESCELFVESGHDIINQTEESIAFNRDRSIKEDVIRQSIENDSVFLNGETQLSLLQSSFVSDNSTLSAISVLETVKNESGMYHACVFVEPPQSSGDDIQLQNLEIINTINGYDLIETLDIENNNVVEADTIINNGSDESYGVDSYDRIRTWVDNVPAHLELLEASAEEESLVSDSEIDWRPKYGPMSVESDRTSEESFGAFAMQSAGRTIEERISKSYNDIESDGLSDDQSVVVMRQNLPWGKNSNELYQTYTRRSEEVITSQIVSNYNVTTCENFAIYFLIRNGGRNTMVIPNQDLPQVGNIDLITGSRKILWQNMPEVMNSGCLKEMSVKEIHLHEGLFEIITSEASYVHSLTVLDDHYKKGLENFVPKVITMVKFKSMFSKIHPIVMAARKFLNDLLVLWQEDFMLTGLCTIIEKHYEKFQRPYIEFARQTENICHTFSDLNKNNSNFHKIVNELSKSPEAENLPLDSFLNLPMQRVTKMPLLLRSVIAQCKSDHQKLGTYMKTLAVVDDLAQKCNNAVDQIRRCEEMLRLIQELSFPADERSYGEFGKSERHLQFRSSARRCKLSSLKKLKEKIELFLFNDLFLYGTKTNGKVVVTDYCLRSALSVESIDRAFPCTVMFMLQGNCLKDTPQLVVTFDETSDCQRWLSTLSPKRPEFAMPIDNATQVITIKKYVARRHDEINLEIGDIVEIIEEHPDWHLGQKLGDGSVGWFRSDCCRDIDSEAIKKVHSLLRDKMRELNNKKILCNENIGESVA